MNKYPGNEETGFYPLAMQNLFCPLPNEVPYREQPINLIFSHLFESFKIQEIIDFVKFQYEQESIRTGINHNLPHDYQPQIIEYNKDVFKQEENSHLQKSLNMIFSLAPNATVHLIYFGSIIIENDLGLPKRIKVDYNYLYDIIRELQKEYPDAVYCTNTIEYYPYASADFYYYYLLGEPSFCDKNRKNPIQIPMFLSAGNNKWIQNGVASRVGKNEWYRYTWFSKNFFCQVGGCFPKDGDYEAYTNTSSGFCLPSACLPFTGRFRFSKILFYKYDPNVPNYYVTRGCDSILPVEYQVPYSQNIDLFLYESGLRNCFRVPDACALSGPYKPDLSKNPRPSNGTSLAVIIFAVQFTHMKKYYEGLGNRLLFLPGDESFISKMYSIQRKSNGKAFTYIDIGIIEYEEENPAPLNNCGFEEYVMKGPSGNSLDYGLNPCGLGMPIWCNEDGSLNQEWLLNTFDI